MHAWYQLKVSLHQKRISLHILVFAIKIILKAKTFRFIISNFTSEF